ncbi:hypothetical protein AB0D57_11485 [Streptomyces sp. NPDC048275]|uniref:hypothetical protein n=1 Tax=Streptomyces sp. NPDC048275 TaxID=3155629 RepID=UPI0033CDCDA9
MGYQEYGQRYVSMAGLRARGWTGGIVHRLLGAPDRLGCHPRSRTAPYTRFYRVERVEEAERSWGFRAVTETEAASERSKQVPGAVERRRMEVLERIRVEPTGVPRLDPGKLALRAVGHRARREAEWGRLKGAEGEDSGRSRAAAQRRDSSGAGDLVPYGRPSSGTGDRTSLAPWKVDYLRHRLIHYEQLLDGLPGRGRTSGRAEAVALLRRRIYAAIGEAHPNLAQECARQVRDQGLGPWSW